MIIKICYIFDRQESQHGTNIYGIIRASRIASTECIVINIPITEDQLNFASGVALAFGQLARSKILFGSKIVGNF